MSSRIFEPALQALRVSDAMQGGTPAILYDLCLGLDKLYSEPIDGRKSMICMMKSSMTNPKGPSRSEI
jgi:hypothetical protein